MENISKNIVGLKELRENTDNYIEKVKRGKSFIVVRKSKPVFKISPFYEDTEIWETIIDFTQIKKAGVSIKELLKRI